MAESQTEELVAKKNSTSIIWNWFGFSPNDEAQANVLCKVCTEQVRTLLNDLKRKQYTESQTARGPAAPQGEAAASV